MTQAVDPDIIGSGGTPAFVNDLMWALTLISILEPSLRQSPGVSRLPLGVGWVGDTRCRRRRYLGLTGPGCLR